LPLRRGSKRSSLSISDDLLPLSIRKGLTVSTIEIQVAGPTDGVILQATPPPHLSPGTVGLRSRHACDPRCVCLESAQVLRQTVVTDSFGLHACKSAYTGVVYLWYGVTWQLGTETTMIPVLRCSVVVLACLLSGSLEEEQESYSIPNYCSMNTQRPSKSNCPHSPKHIDMKYLTHLVLFQLSREVKPERGTRDPFGFGGLDAASCWCAFALASPTSATPSSHAKSQDCSHQQHHITCADIELEHLTPSGKSRAIVPQQVTSEVAPPAWPTQMPHLRLPPTAHCRLQTKQHHSPTTPPSSTTHQPNPLSK
jgi:hypothetical protein